MLQVDIDSTRTFEAVSLAIECCQCTVHSDMHLYTILVAIFWCGSVDSRKIRGISSSYKRFYREKKSYLCLDGSKIIPFEQVNDDYCDCEDGSDEPGTSACPGGRFYCTNLGFRPRYIPSSRVNDGICDCCDASDEYNSHTRCQNSCRNLGQRERAAVEGQMRNLDEGLRLKQQLIEEGVLLWREKQAQLRDLQQVAEDLQIRLEGHRRRTQGADRLKELQAGDNGITQKNNTVSSVFQVLDSNKDGSLTADEIQAKVFIQDQEQGLSQDEAMALLGGRHQMNLALFQLTLWDSLRAGDRLKIKGAHGTQGSLGGEETHIKAVDREWEASDMKKLEDAYDTVNMEISDLQRKLTTDYGADREFLFLNSQCYQLKVYEYTYTLCPFSEVTQKSTTGTEVSLGRWGMWSGKPDSQYSHMMYENGEPCWQGGARSTVVTLTCGTETTLQSVKEPSKCQYIMDFQTPVACQPMPKQQGIHSEL
ncbi:glucosidase 2 subunit beta-like isoform X2 [Genypterus blacodes]|uniref:glucosidase 2 subunit beta-like isoform X2 n=1 Tax=Genypterus blacodes TaxID=154954 RepID=UPI003F773DEE